MVSKNKHSNQVLGFAVFVIFFLISSTAWSANKYWVGTHNGNFSDGANWATSSGGAGGAGSPNSSDVAIFDSGSNNCVIDSSVNIDGMSITSGYSGTITQNSGQTITVGASHWAQNGGIFSGGDSTIDNNGDFTLSGGTFTSTSASLQLDDNFTYSGGTFNANGGTVVFDGFLDATIDVTPGGVVFNNVTVSFVNSGEALLIGSAGTPDTITVNGTLTLGEGALGNGTINAKGTVTVNSNHDGNGSGNAATIQINGTGTQTVSFNAGSFLSNILVNNSSATVSFPGSGAINGEGTFTLQAGTVNSTANTFTLAGAFSQSGGTWGGSNSGVTETFNSTVDISGGTFNGGSGTLDVNGAFTLSGGTFNSTSGSFQVASNFTHSAGTYNHNNGSIIFDGSVDATINVSTSISFYNFQINVVNSEIKRVHNNDTVVILNNLTLTNGQMSSVDTNNPGLLEARSHVTVANTYDGGDLELAFKGTDNQNFDLTGAAGNYNGAITINKPSGGTVTLLSSLTMDGGKVFTLTAGTFDLGTYTLRTDNGFVQSAGTFSGTNGTMDFNGTFTLNGGTYNAPSGNTTTANTFTVTAGTYNHNNGTLIFDGNNDRTIDVPTTLTLGSLTVSKNNSGEAIIIASGDTLVVTGTLTCTEGTLTTGNLEAQGNISIATTCDNITSPLSLTGSATQTIDPSSTGGLYDGDVTVNKSGGSASLVTNDWVLNAANQDFIIQSGTFDLAGRNLTVNGTSGTLIVQSGGNLRLQGGETITANASNPQLMTGSTVTYNGTSSSYTLKSYSYKNLTINGGASSVFSAPASLSGMTTLTLTSGIFYTAGYDVTVTTLSNQSTFRADGNETLTISTPDADSGTFEYVGTSTYNSVGLATYYHLTFNGSGGTWKPASNWDVNGTLTITAGTFHLNAKTVNVAGDWVNNATFTHGNGTVVFDSSATTQNISGTNTFYKITATTSTARTVRFPTSTTTTIANMATFTGVSGNVLSLRSSSNGVGATIDFQGIKVFQYLDVKDINNSNATVARCFTGCVDSTGNTNWSFSSGITSATTQTWDFDTSSEYSFNGTYLEVTGGVAQLKDLGGGTYQTMTRSVGGDGFTRRVEVSVSNSNGTTLTNFQVQVDVTYDSDMQSDFDDIRFVDSDETTLLSHYRESKVDGVTATFWVEIPSLPNGGKTIYLYYGNSTLATASSFDNTFTNDYSGDANLHAQWNFDEGSGSSGVTVSDSSGNSNNGTFSYDGTGGWHGSDSVFSSGNAIKLDGSGVDKVDTAIQINTNLNGDFTLEGWAYADNAASGWGWLFGETSGGIFVFGKQNGSASVHYNISGMGTAGTIGSYSAGAWHHWVVTHTKASANSFKIYIDGSLVGTYNHQSQSPDSAGSLRLGARGTGEAWTGKLDEMRVYKRALSLEEIQAHTAHRKYAAVTPTATLGSETNLGNYDLVKIIPASGGVHPAFVALESFSEVASNGTVKYQVGLDANLDGTVDNWYYNNGSTWAVVSTDSSDNNSAAEVNATIYDFTSQVGTGYFYFKAFLISDGLQQTTLESVSLSYSPIVGEFSASTQTVSESAGTVTVTLNTNGAFGQNLSFPYTVSGTATAGGVDHNLGSGNITVTAGATSGSVSFSVVNDTTYEGSETVITTLGSPNVGTTGSTTVQTITITDNDSVPVVGFSATTGSGLESVASPTLTISLSVVSGVDATIQYAVSGGTATGSGTDYTLASGTATILAGATSTTVPLSVVSDSLDENDETVAIMLSGSTNATLGANSILTYTIQDDDATPTVSIADVSVTESESSQSMTFTVSLSAASGKTITVDYATSNNTATAGSDYTATSGTLTINAGSNSNTVAVTIAGDSLDEDNETFTMTLSNPTNTSLATSTATGTINDNDATPTVSFSTSSQSVGEDASSATITVSLSATSGRNISVPFSMSGTATGSGTDYSISSSPLTINAGSHSQTITVTIVNDSRDESNETVIATLDASPTNATLGATTVHTLTVTDNDTAGVTVTESGGSTNLTEGGVGTETYTIVLASQPTNDVTVSLAANSQVSTDISSVVFTSSNWSTAQTVTVSAVDDALAEGNHTGTITHTSSSSDANYGSGLSVSGVTVNITDNDSAAISITESSGSTAVTEGGATDTYTVVLTSQPTADVTVSVSVNAQVSVGLSALTFTTSNWNSAQTVTVTAVDDDTAEGNHTGSITHTSASSDGNYNGLTLTGITPSVTDNDSAGVTITQSGGTTVVTESGSTDTYTVSLTSQPTATVTITLSTTTQLGLSVSSLIFTTSDWNTPQTVTITATNDENFEGSESATITHTSSSGDTNYGSGLSVSSVTVSITDDDSAGVVVTESGEGTTLVFEETDDTYTVVLTSQPTADVTVSVSVSDPVSASPSSLTFTTTNWDAPQTVTLAMTTNVDDEATVTLTHSATSGDTHYNNISVSSVSVSVIGVNRAVVANAGLNMTIKAGSSLSLDGSASEGDNLEYLWTIIHGSGILVDADTAIPTFVSSPDDESGETVVRLTVVNDQNTTDFDEITISLINETDVQKQDENELIIGKSDHAHLVYQQDGEDGRFEIVTADSTIVLPEEASDEPEEGGYFGYNMVITEDQHMIISVPSGGENKGQVFFSQAPIQSLSDTIDLNQNIQASYSISSDSLGNPDLSLDSMNSDYTSTDSMIMVTGALSGDHLGAYLSSGDINNDGENEVLIAAPGAGRFGVVYVYNQQAQLLAVIFGSADKPVQSILTGNYIAQDLDDVFFGPDNQALNDDLQYESSLDESGLSDYTFFLAGSDSFEDNIDLENAVLDASFENNEPFQSACFGDLNGDEKQDLVLAGSDSVLYIFFGNLEAGTYLDTSQADVTVTGGEASHAFGQMVLTGDVTGDGIDDLIVGSPLDGDQSEGSMTIIFGREIWDENLDIQNDATALHIRGDTPEGKIGSDMIVADSDNDGVFSIYSVTSFKRTVKIDLSEAESGSETGGGSGQNGVSLTGSCSLTVTGESPGFFAILVSLVLALQIVFVLKGYKEC